MIRFVSTHIASKRFGYARDHVSRMARTGKVLARRDGGRWLVAITDLAFVTP